MKHMAVIWQTLSSIEAYAPQVLPRKQLPICCAESNPAPQCLSPPTNYKQSRERVWDPTQEAGTRKVCVALIYYILFFTSGSPSNRVLEA